MAYARRTGTSAVAVVLACAALAWWGAPTAGATRASITKADYLAKADAICAAGTAKLDVALQKLGANPTEKQMTRFVSAVYVPNIAAQLAKIQKLGYPPGDKAQLQAISTEARGVLKTIKADPAATLRATTNPWADVAAKQQAYGFTSCGADASSAAGSGGSSGDAVTAAAQKFVGHYTGPWNNTTFGSSGTVDLVVSLDQPTRTVKVVTTLTGNVFGSPAPPVDTFTVALDASDPSKPVTAQSALFGPTTLSLQSDGTLTLDAPSVPSANVSAFTMTLVPTAGGMDGTYQATLRSGGVANGTVALARS